MAEIIEIQRELDLDDIVELASDMAGNRILPEEFSVRWREYHDTIVKSWVCNFPEESAGWIKKYGGSSGAE